MLIKMTSELKQSLRAAGIETFHGHQATISDQASFEAPCGIKWMQIESVFFMGAFSYAVSGFYSHVRIGRYTSIGEQVQVGRASHPLDWMSTSPIFYIGQKLFDVPDDFGAGKEYSAYKPPVYPKAVSTAFKLIEIGNDVYIGHGAFLLPGVKIGNGAVIAAQSVVTKDVPPYAIVAGNPARIKRMRFDDQTIADLSALDWWRFAPWQLSSINTSDPKSSMDDLKRLVDKIEPFEPKIVRVNSLM